MGFEGEQFGAADKFNAPVERVLVRAQQLTLDKFGDLESADIKNYASFRNRD